MAGDSSKRSAPAWQRAQPTQAGGPPSKPETEGKAARAPVEASPPTAQRKDDNDTLINAVMAEESAPPPEGSLQQLEMIENFLADPTVKAAPPEKKRAFLESKKMPAETIDKLLPPSKPGLDAKELLQTFKQQQQQREQEQEQQSRAASPPAQQPPTSNSPPIITYPEFLVDAHKPPPLITPSRILGAAYITSGVATLAYGASKFLINPMIGSLSEARQEFATHTHTRIEDFNERLSKIVSKLPEPNPEPQAESDVDEVESITSDPTELFHRDMGTQTSPKASHPASDAGISTTDGAAKSDAVTRQANGLAIIKEHLNEILEGVDKQGSSKQQCEDSVNRLKHYLDTLMFSSPTPSLGMWPGSDANQARSAKTDAVEELKKEIRGVKGVLLSAKRFPAASTANLGVGRVGSGA